MFRKIRPNILDKINRLQSMKNFKLGAIGKRDVRINKLINKLYNRKNAHDRSDEMGNRPSSS
jgi:hypothetical protein